MPAFPGVAAGQLYPACKTGGNKSSPLTQAFWVRAKPMLVETIFPSHSGSSTSAFVPPLVKCKFVDGEAAGSESKALIF